MHPITRVIVSYASALLNNQTLFTLYSNFDELEKTFSGNLRRALEHFNKCIIQHELRRTLLLPELDLEKEKYIPALGSKNHSPPISLAELGISFTQLDECIKQEISSIDENLQETQKMLSQKEKDLEEKKKNIQSIDNEIKRIQSEINSPNTTEESEKIKMLKEIEPKRLLAKSSLQKEIESASQEITAIEKDIQSSKALHEPLSHLLPKLKSDSAFISLDTFIVWMQSAAFNKYLQGSFIKHIMEQIQPEKENKYLSLMLNTLLNPMKDFPNFQQLLPQYIERIKSLSASLAEKKSEHLRISALQATAENLKQFHTQAEASLAAAKKIAALTHPDSTIAPLLRTTLETRLKDLSKRVLPTPAQPGPSSTPAPFIHHSSVESIIHQGFLREFESPSTSSSSRQNNSSPASRQHFST